MNSKNKQPGVALITGAARRIGAEIARALHQAGYRVVIHCHQSLAAAQQLAATLNHQRPNSALVVQADLSLAHTSETVIKTAIAWGEALHVLINNASLFIPSKLDTCASICHETLYALNVFAPWRLSIAAHPWLAQESGSIINITDIHAETPLKGYAEYCQSKAALWMQTKTLARELAPLIRVNAVAPGAIAWPEQENSLSEAVKHQIIHETPLKMHGEPEFIAQAVLSLLANPFMTGQVLRVDGGRTIS